MKMPDDEQEIVTMLPHSSFGAPACCGCLNGIVRGDQADIVCNECNAVIRTVAAAELQKTLDELELTLDVATATCAHCGAIHVRSGFSELLAFKCQQCGEITKLSDDPKIERFFGAT
jgi:phage FluMu protein Com